MPAHIVNEDRVKPFATEAAFEEWLAANHASAKEVWIKIYKAGSGVPTVTPVQAIDVALCWGWVDGVRKALDETSFLQRYTPRKAKSVWSQMHRDNVARLIAAGRMAPHGQRHVDQDRAGGSFNAATPPMGDTTEATIPTIPADLRVAISAEPSAFEAFKRLSRPDLSELASRTNSMTTAAARAKKIVELVALLAAGGAIAPEQIVPKRTQSNPESAPLAKAEGSAGTPKRPAKAKAKPGKSKAAAAKRPAKAKAKPGKSKAAAAKRPAKAKAKPGKSKAAAAKRPVKAKAKPGKSKAAAAKRPAKATRAAKASTLPKPSRKAKAKKAAASKKNAKRTK
jgi:uncharacterized protein YdeI (YjbR/CyaY-like superfamily)